MLTANNKTDKTMRRANRNNSSHMKLKYAWEAHKKELGLTQEVAADLLGFSSQGTVSDYLNGRIPLNMATAFKFAKLLKVPVTEIWEGDAELVFITMPLEEVEEIAKSLDYEEQLELARRLLDNARQRGSEK